MTITLFTSRVILQTLGVDDFGIYNVVGGIIMIFSFLNASFSEGTQRFITYELGRGTSGNVQKVFSVCVFLHIILGIIIVLIAEPVGLWFIKNKLLIPDTRTTAAIYIYQFSIIAAFLVIVNVPFYALIIAHERMKAFAFISIIEAVIKLLIAYALVLGNDFDRLILYGILMLLSQVLVQIIYFAYCRTKITESKVTFCFDSFMFKKIGKFSSWTIIGSLAYMGVTQGLNLLLGTFFFSSVNAARGIAVQVQNAVNTFVKNFQIAINPQITKSYAAGHISETHSLVFRSARYSFFLLLFPILPILLEINMILSVWLKTVPIYTADFVRVILMISWVNCLGNPLGIAAKASGQIKLFELCAATIKIFVIPCSYVALKFGCPPVSVFIVYLLLEFIALLSNIYITSRLIHYKISHYYRQVFLRIILVVIIAPILPLLCFKAMDASILRFVTILFVSTISSIITIYYLGLLPDEKLFFQTKSKILIYKIIK